MKVLIKNFLVNKNEKTAIKLLNYNNKYPMAKTLLLPCEIDVITQAKKFLEGDKS